MNKAAEIISSDLIQQSRGFVEVGTVIYPVFPLTLEQMVRVFRHGAMIDLSSLSKDMGDFEAMCRLSPQLNKMTRFIAEAVVVGSWFREVRVRVMMHRLRKCTGEQLHANYEAVMSMTGAGEVFRCATLMSGVAMMIANTKATEQ